MARSRLGGKYKAIERGAFLTPTGPRETLAHAIAVKQTLNRPEIGRSADDDPARAAFLDSLKARRMAQQFANL